ncbi:MAG TPA: 2OG-Fe(II) oxygenase [Kofleriaceae bacterium]|nr:2OG-Fe(II) oxygenase [Kofleriaceae bacterium]
MRIALTSDDVPALTEAWRAAQPFPHVVIDGMLSDEDLAAVRAGIGNEPHDAEHSEIVDCFASAPQVTDPALAAFAAAMGSPDTLAAVRAISGKPVTTVEMRSYCYVPGGYLLPHTDGALRVGRQVAFAAYLSLDDQCAGGELELFRCTLDASGDIVVADPETQIAHRGNRLVLFDVSAGSLHQIREVTAGARISLAGWFR